MSILYSWKCRQQSDSFWKINESNFWESQMPGTNIHMLNKKRPRSMNLTLISIENVKSIICFDQKEIIISQILFPVESKYLLTQVQQSEKWFIHANKAFLVVNVYSVCIEQYIGRSEIFYFILIIMLMQVFQCKIYKLLIKK